MITAHQDIAALRNIERETRRAAVHAALEQHVAELAARAPFMTEEGGPGFVCLGRVITLPGGARLRFEGTLEIVE